MIHENTNDSMRSIAQTNLQLYNQLLQQERTYEDIVLIRKAYDLAALLTAGSYQADGKPFLCHLVGTASILFMINYPANFIAFALLHNIYENGDFGEGLHSQITPAKRSLVAKSVGLDVERLIFRFRSLRLNLSTTDDIESRLPTLDETGRQLVVADLADHIEKYVDRGILYFGDASWITEKSELCGERMVAMAKQLGEPILAEMMVEAFDSVKEIDPRLEALRQDPNKKYLSQVLPLSTHLSSLPM